MRYDFYFTLIKVSELHINNYDFYHIEDKSNINLLHFFE